MGRSMRMPKNILWCANYNSLKRTDNRVRGLKCITETPVARILRAVVSFLIIREFYFQLYSQCAIIILVGNKLGKKTSLRDNGYIERIGAKEKGIRRCFK